MINFLSKRVHNKKGFTLIELIVVIAILGILAAVLIPRFSGFTAKANQTQALVSAKQVATAYDSWYAENNNTWPVDAAALAVAKAKVVTMSGVADADITTFETDGGIVVTQNSHTAGRADGNIKVAVIN